MIKGGPKIINDGLVLCLDAHDAKSYAGEPTTNVIKNTATWWGDGGNQTGLGSKGAVAITDENLKYNGYDTVLWTPGTSQNCYLDGSADIPTSETSTEWTFSAYLKYEDGSTISSMSVYMYYPSSDGSSAGTVTDVGGGWYRVRRTRTGSSNYISLAGFTGISAMKKIYISGWQLEKKQYATPVTSPETSRSATNGWVDRSGNSNNGTLTNMIGTEVTHYRDGEVIMPVTNSYLDFDGTDNYVDLTSHSSAFDFGTGNFSIEAWVNGAVNNNYRCIFWHHYNPGFTLITTNGQSPDGAPRFWLGGTVLNGTTSILDSTWHHVLVTRSDATVTIYIDGSQNVSNAGFSGKSATPTTAQAAIGQYNVTSSSYPFDGKISVVRIYNKALTAADVLSNYNATKGRF